MHFQSSPHLWFKALLALAITTIPAAADTSGTSGNFRYSDDGTSITITGFITHPTGNLIIPSTINNQPVTVIRDYAFQHSGGLTNVTIPNSVTSIGYDAFSYCSSMTAIMVDTANPTYSSVDGVLFDKPQSTLVAYPGGKAGAYVIPSSVTGIVYDAFRRCQGLTSVTIPSSVTSFGGRTFFECSGLTSVTISEGVTSIGGGMFFKCSGLTSVTIPSSVTSIGDYAFSDCTSLTSVMIPSSVTSIGAYAFGSCSGLISVTIPSSVTSIGGAAFISCTSLTSVTIPSSVASIGNYAFHRCGGLTSVTISEGVASIGDNAFNECSGLTSVTLPSSVTGIGTNAFGGCSSLTAITVDAANPAYSSKDGVVFDKAQTTLVLYPFGKLGAYVIPSSVTSIGGYAFYNCSGLTSVAIPSSVTSIWGSAFYNCSGLTSVTIPSSVTSIWGYAFGSCSGLISVTIPSSVTSIGEYAFYYCSSLTSATFLGKAPSYMGEFVFGATTSDFTVYYYSGSMGFTSPTWAATFFDIYPAIELGAPSISTWLDSYGLPSNTDPLSTPNHDGVSLLVYYALNLDPTVSQSAKLPKPSLGGNVLSMSYYAGNSNVTYAVQTSTDLQTWTTAGVTLSTPDPSGIVTASVVQNGGAQYLRLVVNQ